MESFKACSVAKEQVRFVTQTHTLSPLPILLFVLVSSQMEVASIPAGSSEWSEQWEENWKPKSEKFELTGGEMYYLEAVQHGNPSNRGISVAVQVHNTWLNPSVVNTYHREKHTIHASAIQLPEIQVSFIFVI